VRNQKLESAEEARTWNPARSGSDEVGRMYIVHSTVDSKKEM
jgi:hypothetical protein